MTDNNVVRLPTSAMGNKGQSEQSLKSGGGDGTSDDMEQRVSHLEKQFDRINDKVDDLRIDMAVIKERVSHLPTKGFVFGVYGAVSAFIIAATLFQSQIQQFFGIAG